MQEYYIIDYTWRKTPVRLQLSFLHELPHAWTKPDMELFGVTEAQIQGNMSSSLSTGFEITDTGLHHMQNARHADSLSTF